MNPDCVVIVDAFSSGKYLAPEFARRGLKCIHARSMPTAAPEDERTFVPRDFTDDLEWEPKVGRLARKITRKRRPVAVVVGSDTGVKLADALAAELGLPGNDPSTSALRRNKYRMTESVGQVVLTADQHMTRDLDEALTWTRRHAQWPIVVKPVASAGSDGVTYCFNTSDVRTAFQRILGIPNISGILNEDVLLQSYLDGPQYVLNAVSCSGRHLFSDIWLIKQRRVPGFANITDYKVNVQISDPVLPDLMEYAQQVLDCCGIENGASHTELRLTEKGPALIETAPRLMGASLEYKPLSQAFGWTQAQLVAETALNPHAFERLCDQGYQPRENIAIFHLNLQRSGNVRAIPGVSMIQSLQSFYGTYDLPEIGSLVEKTEINVARAGFIYLLHKIRQILQSDIAKLRRYCKEERIFDLKSCSR